MFPANVLYIWRPLCLFSPVRSHYIAAWHAAKMMVPDKQGLIVNVSSPGGLRYVLNVPYGVGKAAASRTSVGSSKRNQSPWLICAGIQRNILLFIRSISPFLIGSNQVLLTILGRCDQYTIDSMVYFDWKRGWSMAYLIRKENLLGHKWTIKNWRSRPRRNSRISDLKKCQNT